MAAACLLTSPSTGVSQILFSGPLQAEEGGPLVRLGFVPTPRSADALSRGAVELEIWNGFSNIFEQDSAATHELFVDMERLMSTVTVRVGAGRGIEFGALAAFETTGGGALDPFISWWHQTLGLGNANRGRYPADVHDVRLSALGRDVLAAEAGAFTLTDIRLMAHWTAWRSEAGSAFAAQAAMRLPRRIGAVDVERKDAALTLAGRWALGPWGFLWRAGVSRALGPDADHPILRKSMGYGLVGLERKLGETWSAIVQYQRSSPVLRGIGDQEVDGPSSNLVFGVAGRVGSEWSWEASFQEDLPADTPAVDFTLGLRIAHRW